MKIRILTPQEQPAYYDEILEMLYAGDNDFLPPLSARSSTTQGNLTSSVKTEDGVVRYFEEMKKQRIMVATEDDKLLAFVSFKESYTNAQITSRELPNIYISTLIVKPEARGSRLTQSMYELLFNAYASDNVFTRTWSTNVAHTSILMKFNFEVYCVLENDRGTGIDTVYFVKRP